MPRYQRRFRNFFINKNLQGKMILSVFIAAVLSCIAFMILFGLFSSDSMTIAYKNNELQVGQTPFMLIKSALAANWLFILLIGSLLVVITIIGTHRIAGPLFRFEKALDNMNSKNLTDTIYLRGKDEGKDLGLKINTFNKNLSTDLTELDKNMTIIDDLLNRFNTIEEKGHGQYDDIHALCQAMKNTTAKSQAIIKSYRLLND